MTIWLSGHLLASLLSIFYITFYFLPQLAICLHHYFLFSIAIDSCTDSFGGFLSQLIVVRTHFCGCYAKKVRSRMSAAGKKVRSRMSAAGTHSSSGGKSNGGVALKPMTSGSRGGNADSTKDGADSRIKLFRTFLREYEGINSKADLENVDKICVIGLFQRFGTYMKDTARKSDGTQYKPSAAVQYLSTAKEVTMKAFPNALIFQTAVLDTWYPQLRHALEKSILRDFFARGEPPFEKSTPIDHRLLALICEALLEEGSAESMRRRSALVTTFYAIGRGGEVALTSWKSAFWYYDQCCVVLDWNELKTGEADYMAFFFNLKDISICYYSALADYLICGGSDATGLSTDADGGWMYSDLARKGSAATALTTYIRDAITLIPQRKGDAKNYESTGLRMGGGNGVILHPQTKFEHLIALGGWEAKGVSNAFGYCGFELPVVVVGAKALAEWPNPHSLVVPPTCACLALTQDEKYALDKLKNRLFTAVVPQLAGTNGLEHVADTLMAIKLRYVVCIISHKLT